jgi:hypothetical protein
MHYGRRRQQKTKARTNNVTIKAAFWPQTIKPQPSHHEWCPSKLHSGRRHQQQTKAKTMNVTIKTTLWPQTSVKNPSWNHECDHQNCILAADMLNKSKLEP